MGVRQMILVLLYLLGCAVCGVMGRNTSWGFVGHFLLAIVITPIGNFVIQSACRPSQTMRRKLERVADLPDLES